MGAQDLSRCDGEPVNFCDPLRNLSVIEDQQILGERETFNRRFALCDSKTDFSSPSRR